MNYLKVTPPFTLQNKRLNKYSNITFDLDTRAMIEQGFINQLGYVSATVMEVTVA